ncbi:MAG: tetratricopeptide repeat protein [Bacteroidia bacterium]|nr:tetratricopeptide repeat protein [Bacteroidia bacterium]
MHRGTNRWIIIFTLTFWISGKPFPDTLNFNHHLKRYSFFINNNFDSAFFHLQKALEESKNYFEPFLKLRRAQVLIQLSDLEQMKNNNISSKSLLIQSIRISLSLTKSTDEKVSAYANYLLALGYSMLGVLYGKEEDFLKALDYLMQAKIIQEVKGYERELSDTYTNIGNIYFYLGEPDKALEFYEKSLKIVKHLGLQHSIATTLSNIGSIYFEKKQYELSLGYFEEALQLNKQLNHIARISTNLINIGSIYSELKNYDKAAFFFKESIEYANKSGRVSNIGICKLNLAEIEFLKKNYGKSENLLKESIELFKAEENIFRLSDAYQKLSNIYELTGNYKEAVKYYKLFYRFKDSTVSEDIKYKAHLSEIKYNYEKGRLQDSIRHIAQQEKYKSEIKEQRNQLKIRRIQQMALIVVIFMIAVITFVIYNRFKIVRMQNIIIENQKREVTLKNKEIMDSIRYARRFQEILLPDEVGLRKLIPEAYLIYIPKDVVSGDFYYVHQEKNYIYLAVADCTGHGVPGAMVSLLCRQALHRVIQEQNIQQTNQILQNVLQLIVSQFRKDDEFIRDGMDICLVRIDIQNKGQIQYSGANRPLWVLKNNEISCLVPDKQHIGFTENPVTFHYTDIQLSENESILLFSDGICDQFGGPQNKKLGSKRLKEWLLANQKLNLAERKKALIDLLMAWKGNEEQTDDITLIEARII